MMKRVWRLLELAAVAASVSVLATNGIAQQCVSGSGNGFVPGQGAVDGSWPTVLPTGELTLPLNVTVPGGVSVIHSVKFSLKHTWAGDLQVVLQSPSGTLYNVYQTNDGVFGGGCFSDFYGTYELVDQTAGTQCSGIPQLGCGANAYPSGTYVQEWGAWPNGSSNINNVPLEQIPLASGTWNLIFYDWYVAFDNGAVLSWELCFGQPTPPPPPPPPLYPVNKICVAGGSGGAYGSGGTQGTWPSTLPGGSSATSSAAVINVPTGSTKLVGVKLNSWNHTWVTDTMIVLTDPTGTQHLIYQDDNSGTCGGCSEDLSGDYMFVDVVAGPSGGLCAGGNDPLPSCTSGLSIAPGQYRQYWGSWPSGTAGINNTPVELIPISSGTWTLTLYDWCTCCDDGSFASWGLCFDGPSGPASYCTAGTTTNGCSASMAASNNPSVSFANPCTITVSNVEGQKNGIIFYGLASQAMPWAAGSSSFLCVKPPTQRAGTQTSGGTSNTCTGTLTLDWNAYQTANPAALGNPWSAGNHAFVQAWFRDPPAVKTTNLSDGLDMTYVP